MSNEIMFLSYNDHRMQSSFTKADEYTNYILRRFTHHCPHYVIKSLAEISYWLAAVHISTKFDKIYIHGHTKLNVATNDPNIEIGNNVINKSSVKHAVKHFKNIGQWIKPGGRLVMMQCFVAYDEHIALTLAEALGHPIEGKEGLTPMFKGTEKFVSGVLKFAGKDFSAGEVVKPNWLIYPDGKTMEQL